MAIEYQEINPTAEEYFRLFQTTGWNKKYNLTSAELEAAIAASWYSVSAYADRRLVGYGRVISDGINHALIVDLIVDPEHQRRGIGAAILQQLVSRCREHNIRDVQLFCAKGKSEFYRKHGFVPRPEDAPGMELKQLPWGEGHEG